VGLHSKIDKQIASYDDIEHMAYAQCWYQLCFIYICAYRWTKQFPI